MEMEMDVTEEHQQKSIISLTKMTMENLMLEKRL